MSGSAHHSDRARYVAIIADGNRRWAKARGLPTAYGHRAGADTLRARLGDAIRLGIRELTVFSFSTENWTRPPEEVQALTAMLARRIAAEAPRLHARGIDLRFIGRRSGVAQEIEAEMRHAERLTTRQRRLLCFVAFDYGGRAEILHAAQHFPGGTEEDFRRYLYAPEMHEPELIIRTGAEQRLSNFLLWQAAYAELDFRPEMWPDFTAASLEQSLEDFRARRLRARTRQAHAVDGPATNRTLPAPGQRTTERRHHAVPTHA